MSVSIDLIAHLLSIQYDELMKEKLYNKDGDMSEYDDSDEDTKGPICAVSKEKYRNDLRSVRSLYSTGWTFWDIMDAISRSQIEPRFKISRTKNQIIELTGCKVSKETYYADHKTLQKNERLSIKALHKAGIRLGQLSCFFPVIEKIEFPSDEVDMEEYNNILTNFATDNSNFVAWFSKRTKRNKPEFKLEPYLYENVDINCWPIGFGGDYPEWKGCYRLNVAKSFFSNNLYYSIKVSKEYTDDDTCHPFHNVKKYYEFCDDDDVTELIGTVVNSGLNRIVFSYLAMTNEKLHDVTGNIFCAEYRQSLISLLQKSQQ
jgi:hypothetical protein